MLSWIELPYEDRLRSLLGYLTPAGYEGLYTRDIGLSHDRGWEKTPSAKTEPTQRVCAKRMARSPGQGVVGQSFR